MFEVGGKVLESVKSAILPELAVIKQNLAVISLRLDGIDKRFDDLRQDLDQRLTELRADFLKNLRSTAQKPRCDLLVLPTM
jgi:hypothetical protein